MSMRTCKVFGDANRACAFAVVRIKRERNVGINVGTLYDNPQINREYQYVMIRKWWSLAGSNR